MAGKCWLVKQEPDDYSWDDFVRDGKTAWTGIRNFQARNFIREMSVGDQVLFYHSGSGREVVGVASVKKGPYPDPTAKEGDWWAVDLVPVKALGRPVTLAELKSDPGTSGMLLLRQTRLSVTALTPAEFARVLAIGKS